MTTAITKENITDLLRTVIDPEIGINIIDLGLVYDINIDDKQIDISMTLTTPGCPMHSSITNWVKRIIEMTIPESSVDVNLVWEPKWTPDKMSDDAKLQLGM
ncbi:MAG: metal-sulfur cluster assembly factor [Ignavibacterium sp.]|uniref:metal-sulfur cluster assembly factor n=1 Tax=Ignavibacterium album TaxID=591197 RepID=UPI0026EA6EF1|nr:metal-sulfur cluster assembly factor [Ignavibacterium album]MCA2004490.1 metal-sulfur cluster assembly factor [Ignavibacterium sp.]MCX8106413.1 metal-sulfur cluster assembly factor [Ignavibacterium album]